MEMEMAIDIEAVGKQHQSLLEQWQPLFDEVRARRLAMAGEFAKCYRGQGAGPTLKEIDEIEALEAKEQALRKQMDDLIRATFG
jgi:hypothetical protein